MIIDYDRINQLPHDGELEELTVIETDKELNISNIQTSSQNEIFEVLNTTDNVDVNMPFESDLIIDSDETNEASNSGVVAQPTNVLPEVAHINNITNTLSNDSMEVDFPPHESDPLSEFNTPFPNRKRRSVWNYKCR